MYKSIILSSAAAFVRGLSHQSSMMRFGGSEGSQLRRGEGLLSWRSGNGTAFPPSLEGLRDSQDTATPLVLGEDEGFMPHRRDPRHRCSPHLGVMPPIAPQDHQSLIDMSKMQRDGGLSNTQETTQMFHALIETMNDKELEQAAGTDRSVQRWGTIWGRALKSGAGFDKANKTELEQAARNRRPSPCCCRKRERQG